MLDARKSTFGENVHHVPDKNEDRVRCNLYLSDQVEELSYTKGKKVKFTSGNELEQVGWFDPDSFAIISNEEMGAQRLLDMKLIPEKYGLLDKQLLGQDQNSLPDKSELTSLCLLADTTEKLDRNNYILTQMKNARKNNNCQSQTDGTNIDISLNKAIQSLEKLKERKNNMLLQNMRKLKFCISQSIEKNKSHNEHTDEERESLDNVLTGLKEITKYSTNLRILVIDDYFKGYKQEYKIL